MAKHLSDTARTVLAEAAGRADLHLLPLPTTLKAPPVIIGKTVSMLIRTGLAAEVPAGPGEPLWDQSEASTPVTLVATPAGLAAIGIEGEVTTPSEPASAQPGSVGKPTKAARAGAKAKVAAATRTKAASGRTSGNVGHT